MSAILFRPQCVNSQTVYLVSCQQLIQSGWGLLKKFHKVLSWKSLYPQEFSETFHTMHGGDLNMSRPFSLLMESMQMYTIKSLNSLLPDGIKLLCEPVLTYHQKGSMTLLTYHQKVLHITYLHEHTAFPSTMKPCKIWVYLSNSAVFLLNPFIKITLLAI